MNAPLLSPATILVLLSSALSADDSPLWVVDASLSSISGERLLLTPENAQEQGYWIRAGVYESQWGGGGDRALPPGLRWVNFRLGLVQGGRLHAGPFGVGEKELQIIRATALVVRKGDEVILRAPLRMVVDLGNKIHLYAEFNAQPEFASKLAIEFEERLESGSRKYAVPLNAFLDQRQLR